MKNVLLYTNPTKQRSVKMELQYFVFICQETSTIQCQCLTLDSAIWKKGRQMFSCSFYLYLFHDHFVMVLLTFFTYKKA